jgi:hypothetical protein
MTLPTTNTSYRLYGDGPGISTILFTGTTGGISATDMKDKTLQVEGLTLKANTASLAGATALYGNFNSSEGANTKFRSATIRNIEIRGSDTTYNPTGYWGNGIWLYRAQNAYVEDVQIHGKYDFNAAGPASLVGLNWFSSTTYPATQIFLHNIHISYFQIAVATSGWVEGFYMSGFELIFCGYPSPNSHAAMELTGANPNAVPVFHISDGHINQISSGIRITNAVTVDISRINFLAQKYDGTHVTLTNCSGVQVNDNAFNAVNVSGETMENGIYSINSHSVVMRGNSFAHVITPGVNGSCIVVDSASSQAKILDNTFATSDALHKYNNMAADTYIRDIP